MQKQEKYQVINNQTQPKKTGLKVFSDKPEKAIKSKSAVQSTSFQRLDDRALMLNISGNFLFKNKKYREAANHFKEAIRLKPELADAHFNLGQSLWLLGEQRKAISCMQEALMLEPDNASCRSALGYAASNFGFYINGTFDRLAPKYDATVNGSQYLLGELKQVIDEVDNLNWDCQQQSILDLGCGTGQFIENANTKFGTTVGVDSSINMLSIANQKRLYNELIHDDIFSFLKSETRVFDLVIAVSVSQFLNGDQLRNLCQAVDSILKGAKSRFIFSFDVSAQPINKNYNSLFTYSKEFMDRVVSEHLSVLAIKCIEAGRFEVGQYVETGIVICSKKS